MLVTRTSQYSKKENTLDLDITQEAIDNWQNTSMLIQDAFPGLSADEREFLLTGITKQEWDEMFPPDQQE